jgi:elongator complex protein 1
MRNLRNIKDTCIEFPRDHEGNFTPISATAWDPSDDSLVCAFGPTSDDPLLSLKRFPKDAFNPEHGLKIASWDAPSPNPDLATDKVLNLHCFADTRTIVLILAGGDIILVREEPEPGQDPIEIVGSVDSGIAAARWSPDEELLVIATSEDTVLFMTRDFESTANVAQSSEDVKVSDHVSVGWGKKETQFEGRGAKALRDPTVPEHVDEGTLDESDDGRTSITWRGDGQFVAINAVIKDERWRRIIRFYTREGVLDSVSAPVDRMGGALSWKPSGQLVAAIQHPKDHPEDTVQVVFFERNGLRHGEFSLRLSPEVMNDVDDKIHLSWNVDSTVLAVTVGRMVQLWTTANYHWYLKQEIIFNEPNKTRPVSAVWHPEKPLRLVCDDGLEMRSLDFNLDIACGPVTPPHDTGLVAVIDGHILRLTPLRRANVPPPQAYAEIDLPFPAVDVAFSRTGTEMAVLHAASISLWTCDYSAKPIQPATMTKVVEMPSVAERLPITRQIAISPDNRIISICSGPNRQDAVLASGHFDVNYATVIPLFETITTVFSTSEHKQLLCESTKAELFSISLAQEGFAELIPSEIKLPVACPKVAVWHGVEQNVTIGLTAGGVMHVLSDYKPLKIPGCTSFALAPSHLIYTTSQHLLKFIHLHDGELEVPADEPEKDERCRNVERGAKLVTVMPSAYSLVLQMPRGNLETIYPRALVLTGIRASINDKDYKKAFKICRVQRVDMNILHDYAPEQFVQNIELFVKQVKKTEYIDLVLTSLSEENVAETMYKETLRATTNEPVPGGHTAQATSGINAPSKVNSICDAFIAVLQKDRAKHLQSIVTAHVSKEPADLEAGLQLVSEIRKDGSEKQLVHAVEHICFLADVNRLYETALGLYDLDVALLVAQQSQKDPKEYLPYLQNLLDQQPLRQRFAIDNDLKRYRKALTHLHAMGEFDELKAFIGKHELYGAAMELYRYDDAKIHELMGLYAQYLSSRNRYEDAGIAYDFVKDYAQAYEAYRSASMWRESLASAALVPVTDSELSTLAQDLAAGQEESKDFVAAATIYVDYLDDLPTALRLLCKANKFAEAMRLAVQHKKPELIAKVVDQGLVESSASMTELLADMKTQLNEQVPRIRELRQKKAEDPMAFLGEADDAGGDVPDNLSIAPSEATTSGGTLMTRYTNRSTGTLATNATRKTSKNRRREERKRAKGKKGTVYEEEYLVNSVVRLIERLNSTSEDVTSLLHGLMRRAMRERAVAVEVAMAEVVAACKVSIEQVFDSHAPEVKAGGDVQTEGEHRPWGGQGVHWEALSAAGKRVEAPMLKAFERLSLLQ